MISYLQKKMPSCNRIFSSIFVGSFPFATFSKEAFMAVETQTGPKSWSRTFSALESRVSGAPPQRENYERRFLCKKINQQYMIIYIIRMNPIQDARKLDICCLAAMLSYLGTLISHESLWNK